MTDKNLDAGAVPAVDETDPAALFDQIVAEQSAQDVPMTPSPIDDAKKEVEAGGEKAIPAKTEAAEVAVTETPPDVWADATPVQKAAWESAQKSLVQLERDNRSLRGRVPVIQRELDGLKRKGAEALTADKPRDEPRTLPSEVPVPGDEDWDKFALDYPEIAKPLERKYKRLESAQTALENRIKKFDEVEDRVKAVEQGQETIALDNEAAMLLAKHPDFITLRDSPDFDRWLSAQPPTVQALRDSPLAVDADYLLTHFKNEVRPASAVAPVTNGGGDPPRTQTALEKKRANQLESSASPRGSIPAAVMAGVPEDEESAFNFFARKAAK
jgi:hypothetical protein